MLHWELKGLMQRSPELVLWFQAFEESVNWIHQNFSPQRRAASSSVQFLALTAFSFIVFFRCHFSIIGRYQRFQQATDRQKFFPLKHSNFLLEFSKLFVSKIFHSIWHCGDLNKFLNLNLNSDYFNKMKTFFRFIKYDYLNFI